MAMGRVWGGLGWNGPAPNPRLLHPAPAPGVVAGPNQPPPPAPSGPRNPTGAPLSEAAKAESRGAASSPAHRACAPLPFSPPRGERRERGAWQEACVRHPVAGSPRPHAARRADGPPLVRCLPCCPSATVWRQEGLGEKREGDWRAGGTEGRARDGEAHWRAGHGG